MKKCDCENHNYPSHDAQIPRLNRAIGQLEGIKRMITDRKYCPDILIQFKAVKSAIHAAEVEILNEHLNSCVARSFESAKDRDKHIAEIKKLISQMV
ncbi:MAG: metal-sensitive transcriptional regulator [Alphaproteobacteria bacterium]|nr:metal-sensitive transcriptional regulator [Alphaproteobacteria bacterium]